MKLTKNFANLILMLFTSIYLFSCAQNPCDKYIGTWAVEHARSSSTIPITVYKIKKNGPNYLIEIGPEFILPNTAGGNSGQTYSAVCENGLLTIPGYVSLNYIQDGDYILFGGSSAKLYRK